MAGWLGRLCSPHRFQWLAAAMCVLLAMAPAAHAQSSAQLDTAAAKFETLANAGKTDAAIALGNRLVRAARRALPASDIRRATYLTQLATLYSQTNKSDIAAKLALEALLLPQGTKIAESEVRRNLLESLAAVLVKANRLDDAEAAITRALALAEASEGPDSPALAGLRFQLSEIYQLQGRMAEASSLRQRLPAAAAEAKRDASKDMNEESGPALPPAASPAPIPAPAAPAPEPDTELSQPLPDIAEAPPAASDGASGGAGAGAPPAAKESSQPDKKAKRAPRTGTVRRNPAAAPPPEPAPGARPSGDFNVVDVFYGTNRQVGSGTVRVTYTSSDANKLTLGMARVTVPVSHQVPQVERPWALRVPGTEIEITFETQDPKKHFTIASIEALPQDQFLAKARDQLARSKTFKGQAFVFVHGFYNTFDDALYRTAQIAYDMQFDGATFMYSWPSAGTLDAYRSDLPRAKAAGRHLRAFLDLVAHKTGATRISVIAHSMGNRPLMEALDETVALDRPSPDAAIDEVVLAAPDLGREEFSTMISHMQNIRGGITLYAASNDLALAASQTFNREPRAGDTRYGGPLLLPHMDTIDATLTSLQLFRLNHYYVAESSSILCDLEHILRNGERPPDKRSKMFMSVKDTQGTYYAYRP